MKPGDTTRTEFLLLLESHDGAPLGYVLRDRRTRRFGVQWMDLPLRWYATRRGACARAARLLAPYAGRFVER